MYKMKYTILFALLGCYKAIAEDVSKIVFDIKNESDGFVHCEGSCNGNKKCVHFPRTPKSVGKVVDGTETIWEQPKIVDEFIYATTYRNCHDYLLLKLCTSNGDNSTILFYEKVNGLWSVIDEALFKIKSNDLIVENTFDISHPQSQVSSYTNITPSDNTVVTYLPAFNNKLTKIVESGTILWERESPNDFCDIIRVHSREGKFALVSIQISSIFGLQHKYFELYDYEWRPILESEYLEIVEEIEDEIMLNLNKIYLEDNEHFAVSSYHPYGIPALSYIPEKGFNLVKVFDNNLTIWKAGSRDDKCVYANLHLKDDLPRLLELKISNLLNATDLYYIKVDSEWRETDHDNFLSVLRDLDIEEDKKKYQAI